MIKRLLAISLALTLLTGFAAVSYAEEAEDVRSYEHYNSGVVDFAVQMGIASADSNNDLVLNKEVTRAELAKAICCLLDIKPDLYTQLNLTDMTPGNEAYGYVASAIRHGLFKEPQGGMFFPESTAYVYQLTGTLIDVLGYRPVTEDNTEWLMAAKLGLLDDVALGENDTLDVYTLCLICYNAIEADIMYQSEFGETEKYSVSADATIMTEYHDATYATGIVTANSYTTLTSGADMDPGYIMIDGNVFKSGNKIVEALIGYDVEYWYNSDDEIVAIVKSESNNTLELNADMIESADRSGLEYYKDDSSGKAASVKFSVPDVIYNGKALYDFEDSDLTPETGWVTLIDNNGDKKYDVILIREFESYYILNVDGENKRVTDDLYGRTFSLDADDFQSLVFQSANPVTGSLYSSQFETIVPKSVLSVMKSKDGECVTVVSSSQKVSGLISEVSEADGTMTVTVGAGKYRVAGDFYNQLKNGNPKAIKPECAMAATLYLNFCGEISFVSCDLSEWRYGFVTKCKSEGGLNELLKVRLMNDEGVWETLNMAEKFELNGTPYKDHALASERIGNLPQIIKYKLKPDNTIGKIETYTDNSSLDGYIGYDENAFTKDSVMFGAKYKTRDKTFSHKYAFELSTTTMFYVPKNMLSGAVSVDEDEVMLVGNSYWMNDKTYDIEIYDSDRYFVPRVLVVTNGNDNYDKNLFFVNKKSKIMDSDGEATYKLSGIMGGIETEYVCSNESVAESVQVGDALRVFVFSNGRIIRLERVVNFAGKTGGTALSLDENTTHSVSGDYNTYYVGSVYDVDYERGAVMIYTTNPADLTKFSGANMKIMVYDSKNDEFVPGTINQIYAPGSESADMKVFIHDYSMETYSFVAVQ